MWVANENSVLDIFERKIPSKFHKCAIEQLSSVQSKSPLSGQSATIINSELFVIPRTVATENSVSVRATSIMILKSRGSSHSEAISSASNKSNPGEDAFKLSSDPSFVVVVSASSYCPQHNNCAPSVADELLFHVPAVSSRAQLLTSVGAPLIGY